MFETSEIEISASALQSNLKFIRKQLKPGVRFCSVVKGNAYGHGLAEYVQLAMEFGVDYFAVHSADEAFKLVESLPKKPDLFIMGSIDDLALKWAIQNEIEFAVFDFNRLQLAIEFAKEVGKKAKIHVEIETGMKRTGFSASVLNELIFLIKENFDFLILQGLFTHFAGAESQANDFRIKEQKLQFDLALKQFGAQNLRPIYHHSACSAALINYPETQGNMVRVGILQYGFWPNSETHVRFCGDTEASPNPLKRIIRWKTSVMSIKEARKGSFVGYGTSFFAYKNMKLAIIPVGYSHGYNRNLSNVGSVLIHGKSAQVVGTINMNSLTVDVTSISDIIKGDEVVLIGKQNGKTIGVNSFSEQSQQLNYELLTRLPLSIPRRIVK